MLLKMTHSLFFLYDKIFIIKARLVWPKEEEIRQFWKSKRAHLKMSQCFVTGHVIQRLITSHHWRSSSLLFYLKRVTWLVLSEFTRFSSLLDSTGLNLFPLFCLVSRLTFKIGFEGSKHEIICSLLYINTRSSQDQNRKYCFSCSLLKPMLHCCSKFVLHL